MNDPHTSRSGGLPGAFDETLTGFTCYLGQERGLAATTVENYLNQVRPFVIWYARQGQTCLEAVTIRDVHGFLTCRSETCSAGSIKVATTALRALLRWMYLDARLPRQLADGIGPVRYLASAGLPGPGFGVTVGAAGAAVPRGRPAPTRRCGLARRDRHNHRQGPGSPADAADS